MTETATAAALVDDIKRFVGFTDTDAAALALVREAVLAATPTIVANFYEQLMAHSGASRAVDGPEQVERLKSSLARWLDELVTGPWDAAYAQRRRRVGQVHVRVRLPQMYVIGAMQQVQRSIHDVVYESALDPATQRTVLTALHRVMALDLALMVESYQTEREEEAVRAYRAIVRNTSDVVLTARPDGRVLHANRGCPGVSRSQFVESGTAALTAVLAPTSREQFDRAWAAAVDDRLAQEHLPVEHVDPTTDARHHSLVTLLPDHGDGDRAPLIHVVIRDVTELRSLEGDLEEQRRLAAVGEMIAGVAHEVRNPLQNVLLGLRRITDSAAGPVREDAVAQVREGAGQIERLVSDLLSFSKRLSLSTSVLDAGELARNAVQSCAAEFPDRTLPMPSVPPGGDVLVRADPFRLPQALRNLVQNALEAVSAIGVVSLSVVLPDDEFVDFVVADDGPGLPEEVRARLCEPFVTTKPGGTGLGLAIARRLVEAHGGRLTFADRPGGGTLARVRLTRARRAPS